MIKSYTLAPKDERWDNFVNASFYNDIYFGRKYFSILAEHYNATGQMFICELKEGFYAIPYIKRPIRNNYYDIISSWYYGGPLYNFYPTEKKLVNIENEFFSFCKSKNIVSIFMYLHPYLHNYKYMFDSKNIEEAGKIIYVNTIKKNSQIWKDMNNSRKGSINSSYNYDDLKIVFDNSENRIMSFLNIYRRAMKAKKADKFFFFNKSFFVKLREYYENNFKLVSAIYQNKVIAGNVFLNSRNISYYYLSARELGYSEINAPSRLVFEMVKSNSKKGIKCTDLGGGHKSLFRFKESFSKTKKTKYIYKKVLLKKIYRELCDDKIIKYENADFFPEYRKGLK